MVMMMTGLIIEMIMKWDSFAQSGCRVFVSSVARPRSGEGWGWRKRVVQGPFSVRPRALGRVQHPGGPLSSLQGHQPAVQGVLPGHHHLGRPLPGLEEEYGPGGRGDCPLLAAEDGGHQRVHPESSWPVPEGHGGERDPCPLPGGPHLGGCLVCGCLLSEGRGRSGRVRQGERPWDVKEGSREGGKQASEAAGGPSGC